MQSVDAFIEDAQRCQTIDELGRCMQRAMAKEGYANVVFCRISADGGLELPWDDMPPGYMETYRALHFETCDPILAHLPSTRGGILRWADVTENVALTQAERNMIESARAMGVHTGISFPFHGPDGQCDVISMSLRTNDRPDPARTPMIAAKTFHTWSRYWHLTNGASPPDLSAAAAPSGRARRRFHWISDDEKHRGGPPGMTSVHCRALVLADIAARRAEAGLMDLSFNLFRHCSDQDLERLLKWGFLMEVPNDLLMRYFLAPTVLGRAHLATCPAAPEFRRDIWEMDVRRGELPMC